MEFKNDEEVLDFITRLLERLHQAGFDQPGSHYQFVYVASQPQAETHPIQRPTPSLPVEGGGKELRVLPLRDTPPLTPPLKGVGNCCRKG